MINFFTTIIFSNPIYKYFIFIFVLFLNYPFMKLFKLIFHKYLVKFTDKTKFKFDDILVESLIPSMNLFIFAGLFYIAYIQLALGIYKIIFEKIFNFLIIIPLVFFSIKFFIGIFSFYLKGGHSEKIKVNETGIDLLMQIITLSLYLIGILLILANLGYNITTLIAGLGVGGLAFALAAQDILKNFFAGITLIFDKTFTKNEKVQFNEYTGVITELKLRSTKIRTYQGEILTIPNSMLAENIVKNISKVKNVKVSFAIGVIYSTSTKKLKDAKEIIKKIILDDIDTLNDNVWIWFDNFGPYSLNIQIIFYENLTMNDWPKRVYVKDRINFKIKEEFEKVGIEMAFPTQTIEIKK